VLSFPFFKKNKLRKRVSCYLDFASDHMAVSFFNGEHYEVIEKESINLSESVSAIIDASQADIAVVATLGSYKNMTVEKPAIPEEEIGDTLRWDFASNVSFDVETASVDYFLFPQADHNDKPMLSAFILPEKSLIDVNSVLVKARATLGCITLPEMAITELLSRLDRGRAFAGLVLADTGSFLIVAHQGQIYLNRQLKGNISSLIGDINSPGSDKIIKECSRTVNYFVGKFSQIPLGELHYFTDKKYTNVMSAVSEKMASALNLEVKAYDYTPLELDGKLPESLPGQLSLGMAMLKQRLLKEERGVPTE